MIATRTAETSLPSWHGILRAASISEAVAAAALGEMELDRVRNLRSQRPVAERLLTATGQLGRDDLTRRAQLILADITAREGNPIEAADLVREVQREAERADDQFAAARALFVLSWVDYSIGNYPAAQVNAIRSVEILPDDVPVQLLVDHTLMIGNAYGNGEDGQHYFDEALDLARAAGDQMRVMIAHNNSAYSATERGDLSLALRHITAMREVAEAYRIQLFAIQFETTARVYILAGRYAEAVAVLADVVDRSGIGSPGDEAIYLRVTDIPLAMLTMAEAHRHLGNVDEAHEFLDRAATTAAAHGIRMVSAQVREQRAHLLAAGGDYQAAFEEFTAFYDAIRELEAEEERARARVVQAAFGAERTRRDAEHYRELAMRDALTGLHNRRYLDEMISTEIDRARQADSPLSLAIIDADLFKRINDELSHDVGDTVLQTLAAIFTAQTLPTEVICRLGGEEFVLLMPGAAAGAAVARCETIRRAVADHDWTELTGSIPLTVSIGMTTVESGRTSTSAILSDADRNLYAAKRSGRNRVMSDARG